MKAAIHERYGSPEVVRIAEVEKPTPKDDEVLVRVHATTVNRTDCGFRGGKPFVVRLFSGLPRPKVKVWGSEFAGVVEAVGAEVTSFAVGDRVFGYDDSRFGAHAEYKTMREDGLIATIPEHLTFEQAAPGCEGSHYALAFLKRAKIGEGSQILVYGATGAIGSAAVQLAKSMGGSVTAVCDTANVKLVQGLGADKVVDYTAGDFTNDDQSYDMVLDAVGKSSFGHCKKLLKPGGMYMSSEFGPRGQNPFLALVTPLFRGKKVVFPLAKQDPEMVRFLRERMETGDFKPVIDRRFPLDRIVEAYRYVETGRKIGNVVVNVEEGPSRN
jgi:NADPH:quinone reductase-like Zn-dependent oxidoreductase